MSLAGHTLSAFPSDKFTLEQTEATVCMYVCMYVCIFINCNFSITIAYVTYKHMNLGRH